MNISLYIYAKARFANHNGQFGRFFALTKQTLL